MFPFCATKNPLEEMGLALTAMLGHRMILQLCLEEELLWTLCAVIDLVLLSMG